MLVCRAHTPASSRVDEPRERVEADGEQQRGDREDRHREQLREPHHRRRLGGGRGPDPPVGDGLEDLREQRWPEARARPRGRAGRRQDGDHPEDPEDESAQQEDRGRATCSKRTDAASTRGCRRPLVHAPDPTGGTSDSRPAYEPFASVNGLYRRCYAKRLAWTLKGASRWIWATLGDDQRVVSGAMVDVVRQREASRLRRITRVGVVPRPDRHLSLVPDR